MDGEKDMVRNVTRSPLAPVPTTTSQSICWALEQYQCRAVYYLLVPLCVTPTSTPPPSGDSTSSHGALEVRPCSTFPTYHSWPGHSPRPPQQELTWWWFCLHHCAPGRTPPGSHRG